MKRQDDAKMQEAETHKNKKKMQKGNKTQEKERKLKQNCTRAALAELRALTCFIV